LTVSTIFLRINRLFFFHNNRFLFSQLPSPGVAHPPLGICVMALVLINVCQHAHYLISVPELPVVSVSISPVVWTFNDDTMHGRGRQNSSKLLLSLYCLYEL